MKTADAARDKWPVILMHFGIDESFLRNIHGPCPLCGGKDRFRFDDKGGNGTYYCNSCGPGDGFELLIKHTGRQFADIAKEIDGIVGNIEVTAVKPAKRNDEKRIRWILNTLDKSNGINPVRLYLKGRGLQYSPALAYHPGIKYFHGGELIGTYPAMVARFSQADGSFITLHLTYLTNQGKKADLPAVKKFLTPVQEMNGGAIRLTKIYPHIGVAEGIETALAVMRDFKLPCWATGTAGMLEAFIPPDGIEKVTVFGDNDQSFTGQAAAYVLAKRLRKTREVSVMLPEVNGDFADVERRLVERVEL